MLRALDWMMGLEDVTFLGLELGEVATVPAESVRTPFDALSSACSPE